jgi:negative regulator of sigma E activity
MRFRLLQDKDFLRIEPLGGLGFLRRHGWFLGDRHGMPMPPRPPEGMELELARRNYDAVLERTDSVSGRLCEVIRLKPRHPGGNGRRLWIDPVTGLALRRDQYDAHGELLRSSVLESVRHLSEADRMAKGDAAPPGAFPMDASELRSPEEIRQWLGFAAPQVKWVPEGFAPMGTHTQSCPEGPHALRMGWSDGLASFSVFVSPRGCLPPHKRPPALLRWLPRWGRPREGRLRPPMILARLGDDCEIVAMGDVPRALLKQVVLSMGTDARSVRILSEPNPERKKP